MTAIPLGAPLPTRSSHLPADVTRAASMSAYLVLLRMEVAAFHPPGFDSRRLVSVALFVTLPCQGVTLHPALRSPDFPLPAMPSGKQRLPGRLPRLFYCGRH